MTLSADAPFGPEQLSEILRDAGFPLSPDELAENADTPFAEWGLDSLALLELAAILERQLKVPIDDDEAARLVTPGATLERVAVLRADGKVSHGRAD